VTSSIPFALNPGNLRHSGRPDLAETIDSAVDTYDRDEYGSFKSTLRSAKFLQKIDSKMKMRIAKLAAKELPDLSAICKSIKVGS
jgi:hypothetical protein